MKNKVQEIEDSTVKGAVPKSLPYLQIYIFLQQEKEYVQWIAMLILYCDNSEVNLYVNNVPSLRGE